MTEASAIVAEGRISPQDAGIWNQEQVEAWKPITTFIREQGSLPGIQLAHAGRKASTPAPWNEKVEPSEAWEPVAPSPLPFSAKYPQPRALRRDEVKKIPAQFAEAAWRALQAGFEVVEIHAAHGYLLHEFLSPQSNRRKDEYGGSLENRMRLTIEVARAVRET